MNIALRELNYNNADNPDYNKKIFSNTPSSSIKFEFNIISCFISTSKAKIILSRQFVSMNKREMLQLSFLFSRHLDNQNSESLNNFEVKDNNYRFIYQTLYCSDLYIILVTKISFNIFQSIDLLKLVHRIISELCILKDNIDKDKIIPLIKEKAFDIILAIDDIINPIIGKEQTDILTVKSNLVMDSNLEKIFYLAKKEKEDKARDNIVKGMEEIEKLKRQNKYVSNSVSSQILQDKENKYVEETDNNNNKNYDEIINVLSLNRGFSGMNLSDRMIQRIMLQKEENRLGRYMVACNNILQSMIVNEIKMQIEGEDLDDHNDAIIRSGGTFIITSMYESGSDDESSEKI